MVVSSPTGPKGATPRSSASRPSARWFFLLCALALLYGGTFFMENWEVMLDLSPSTDIRAALFSDDEEGGGADSLAATLERLSKEPPQESDPAPEQRVVTAAPSPSPAKPEPTTPVVSEATEPVTEAEAEIVSETGDEKIEAPVKQVAPNSDIWEPNPFEEFAVGTFQGRIPKGEKRFGRFEWGHKYTPVRVFCLVPTLWPSKKARVELIVKYYGHLCTEMQMVVCESENPDPNNKRLLRIDCDFEQSKGARNIWNKVMYMWHKAGTTRLDDFDWFLKIDDDTFFSPTNFRNLVQYYDPLRPWYLGHTLLHRWRNDNIVFNSGTCYAISQGTLRLVTPLLTHIINLRDDNPALTGKASGSLRRKKVCGKRGQDEEDPTFAICMREVGVLAANSLDAKKRQRFLPFRDEDHKKIKREGTWYWTFKPKDSPEMENCCVEDLISMHNYKDRPSVERLFPKLIEKYNNTHPTELPPEPQPFLFEKGFATDVYFNPTPIPAGQWVQLGPGLNFTCWMCDEGGQASRQAVYDKIERNLISSLQLQAEGGVT